MRSTQPNPVGTARGERSSRSPATLVGTHGAAGRLSGTHPEIDAEIARRDRCDSIICLCGVHVTQATKIKAVWASTPTSKLPALHTNGLRWLRSANSPAQDGRAESPVPWIRPLQPRWRDGVPATCQRVLLRTCL